MLTLALTLLSLGANDPPADAGNGADGGGGLMSFIVPMALVVVIFYVIMIGPEKKQRRKREEMLGSLKKGDHVLTTGGVYGSVTQIQDQVATLQVADGVRLRFSLPSIQHKIEADTEEKDSK